MKKWKSLFLVALMFGLLVGLSNLAIAKNEPMSGSIVKGKGLSTLYHLGEDGQRYVFPNDKTFFSWFDDFTGIQEIDMEDLQDYPLGGNVRYKPGALLVKIQTDPKVYAVGKNGTLRWVKTEQLARKLYGANWNMLIDDVPDAFFVNYKKGDAIENEDDFEPDVEESETTAINYNLGLKQRAKAVKKVQTETQKQCGLLEGAINKIQKRMNRWNITATEIGEDYVNECLNNETNQYRHGKKDKVIICHIPKGAPENAHTIIVSNAAAKAHLAQGSTLGACSDDSGTTTEDDTTSPILSTPATTDITETEATITWTTDEESDSKIFYATESFDTVLPENIFDMFDATMTEQHSLTLEGLTGSTEYHYYVESKDVAENTATSTKDIFETID